MSNWYLLRTATRREKDACASLEELGVEHFLPVETVLRKLNREEGPYDRALFPGYLFAWISDIDFPAAVRVFGVHGPVLKTNEAGERVPRRIPSALVAALQAAQARGDFDRTKVEPVKQLESGDVVHVSAGPFAEKVGAIIELRGKDRLALLLGSVIVEVEAAHVELAA